MSSLPPPTANERFEPPALDLGDHGNAAASIRSVRTTRSVISLGKWRRAAGLFLLGVTIFGWTSTNFLASSIFSDDTYSKPYFVTYINTSFFIIPLIPILIRRAHQHPEELRRWKDEVQNTFQRRYTPLKQEEGEGLGYDDSPVLRSTSNLLEEPMEESHVLSAKDLHIPPSDANEAPLTLPEIAKLSLEFCLLWFLANYFVAACLQYTTVASSTILTSTSSVFTLLFGAIFKVERFTVRKLLGVLASLAGIILISSLDLSGRTNDDEHRGDFPEKTLREIAIGDFLAFLSAVMYGLYAVFMKKRIGDESRVNMPVFFGFVGLINVLLLWPGLFIFHWTNIETFELPPDWRVTLVIILNSVGSLVSDMAWAYAVLLTSPIVVTVGLSMTIPLSLIGQMVLDNQTAGPWYWLGASIVVLSFLFVNHEEKKDDEIPLPITEDGPSIAGLEILPR
ncbi:putative EamA domain-containing protein [Septoria linicola]|nr:putative EamA domain-containing protein [Septoria linicola]